MTEIEKRVALRQEAFYERFGARSLERSYDRGKSGMEMDELAGALRADILKRTFAQMQEDEILRISMDVMDKDTGNSYYRQVSVYPGDTNTPKLLFGEQADAIADYACMATRYPRIKRSCAMMTGFPS